MNLSAQTKLTKVRDGVTAGTSDCPSVGVDMKGFQGVLFLTSYGTAAANNLIHCEGSSVISTTGYADLEGTEVGVASSDEDQWAEVHAPRKRYVRCVGLRGTSSTLGDIWALQYSPSAMPQDNTIAGTIHGEHHLAPSTGTK